MNQLSLEELREKWRHLVVHCKKKNYDVYIGRASGGAPKGVSCDWGNPFPMKNQSDDERERVSQQYYEWLHSNPEMMQRARSELRGKVLACWCDPKYCHGHILANVANSNACGQISSIEATCDAETDQKMSAVETAPVPQPRSKRSKKKKTSSQLESYIGTGGKAKVSKNKVNAALADSEPQGRISSYTTEVCRESTMIDIGVNFTNRDCKKNWSAILKESHDAGVCTLILTGTCMTSTEESKREVHRHRSTSIAAASASAPLMQLFYTAGVHPHRAKTFTMDTRRTLETILREDDFAVAVGECGLDFNRNLSSPEEQIFAFREQVRLAVEIQKPLFVHEREAHSALVSVFDEFLGGDCGQLPPVVIHCFTGDRNEVLAYLERGFYIGLTGTLCKFERGAKLRELISSGALPLNRIMLETDAPYMGFVKGRRNSVPADVPLIVNRIAELSGVDSAEVQRITTNNTLDFFRLRSLL